MTGGYTSFKCVGFDRNEGNDTISWLTAAGLRYSGELACTHGHVAAISQASSKGELLWNRNAVMW